MEIYLISNNLCENNIHYQDKENLEIKKLTRPLSIEGEDLAKSITIKNEFNNISLIYSSLYASALGSAKYLANRVNKKITIDPLLNDCRIGQLGNKNLKMIRFMQNHDFNIKLNEGESLNEVGNRFEKVMNKLIYLENNNKIAVYTHRRAILGFLLKYGQIGYNLDDDLVIEFNDKVIYNEVEKEMDIYKLTVQNKKIVDIEVIDF